MSAANGSIREVWFLRFYIRRQSDTTALKAKSRVLSDVLLNSEGLNVDQSQ